MYKIDFEGTNPRVGVSVGATVPGAVPYSSVKAGVTMEIDVLGEDVEEVIGALTDYLLDRLAEIGEKVGDSVNE